MPSSFLHVQLASRSRLVAYVLLGLVSYGATLGLTHRHGNVLRSISQPAYATLTNSLTARDPTTSTTSDRKLGDCTVCQFQQNLSNAEIFTPVVIRTSLTSASITPPVGVPFLSSFRSTRQGRAPPATC
jgi:hypothetical protein